MEFDVIKREIPYSNSKPEFQASVGLSRSWYPPEAGEEVIVSALEKLKKTEFIYTVMPSSRASITIVIPHDNFLNSLCV